MITGGKGVDRGLANNLQRVQARTEVGGDRTLLVAFREIGKICAAMKLHDVVKHQANEYYKEAHEKSRAIRGKSQAAVYAAIIFLACRQQGYPRTFKEICAFVPQASKKDIGKMYKGIVADLRLKEQGAFRSEVVSNHPENYLRRFMSALRFGNADMRFAIAFANAALPQEGPDANRHTPWHGKSPVSIAGAVIYILSLLPAASQHPPLDSISAVCGVAEATIKAIYKEMHPHLVRERERERRGGGMVGSGGDLLSCRLDIRVILPWLRFSWIFQSIIDLTNISLLFYSFFDRAGCSRARTTPWQGRRTRPRCPRRASGIDSVLVNLGPLLPPCQPILHPPHPL